MEEAKEEKVVFDLGKIALVVFGTIAVVITVVGIMHIAGKGEEDGLQENSEDTFKGDYDLGLSDETATDEGSVDIDFEQLTKEEVEKQMTDNETTELKIEDIKAGDGAEVKAGDTVNVHYIGTLTDGKKFDSSLDRGQPFEFTVGQGNVIQGWDMGLIGMKVGGKRKLTIPSELGYGDRGAPPSIPPKATLIFNIELLEIK